MMPVQQTASSIADRLDRLPVGRFHRRFITLVSLGEWFDMYDLFMVAYVGAALESSRFLSLSQFSELIAAGFLGMFLGTVLFGIGSDRMGRRSAFVVMLLIYSVFTFAGALAPSAGWLIVLRFFAGIGIGAEIVVIDTYVSELVPSRVRGRFVAITQVIGFTSVPVVALLARVLVPTHFLISGWRWVMLIGAAGSLLAWTMRLKLPESPRWLESVGRTSEAEEIVRVLEGATARVIPSPPWRMRNPYPYAHIQGSDPSSAAQTRNDKAGFLELWSPRYRRRTLMLVIFQALQTIGFYGFANWAPTFLLKRGIGLLTSLNYALLIALLAPVGPLVASFTADRLERKWTILVLALLIAAFGLGFALWSAPAMIVLSGGLVTFCANWFSAVFHSYQSELFPTRIRATGVGFTYSWSRLSAAFSAFLVAGILRYGVTAVFAMLAAAMIGVAVVIAFGPQTNRRSLEELSA
ncbi:MAG TPA: MFS transporter [Terriglobales bacterium]|nr:MFS transporter [Terriglobales bacterium]